MIINLIYIVLDEPNIVTSVTIVEKTSQRQLQSFSTKATRAAAIETTTPLYQIYTTTSRPVTKLKALTTQRTTQRTTRAPPVFIILKVLLNLLIL